MVIYSNILGRPRDVRFYYVYVLTTHINTMPSLERASAQSVFITKVKTDPAIPTVSISILAIKGLNAKNWPLSQ